MRTHAPRVRTERGADTAISRYRGNIPRDHSLETSARDTAALGSRNKSHDQEATTRINSTSFRGEEHQRGDDQRLKKNKECQASALSATRLLHTSCSRPSSPKQNFQRALFLLLSTFRPMLLTTRGEGSRFCRCGALGEAYGNGR